MELRRRHRAEEVLSELAATDALTGLANRRTLDEPCGWNGTGHNARPSR